MSAERVPVTFSPAGVTVWVERGVTVLEAARHAGVVLPAPCGGRGVCGACGFRVLGGDAAPPDDIERAGLASAPAGVRLACRARVDGPLEVRPLVNRGPLSESGGVVVDESLVAAVDLGTTTVSAVIVGKATGRELGRATVVNPQESWGSDVLSRLAAASGGEADALRRGAEAGIMQALDGACSRAGACLGGIEHLTIAGNTAMVALLAGADVSALAVAPFVIPDGIESLHQDSEIARSFAEGCEIDIVPAIASFVGGDIAAGLLAAGLIDHQGVALLVDVGTNAEIVVLSGAGLTVSSAAAGPAFEGFGISAGGPWGPGAIEHVAMSDDDLAITVVGGGEPGWICGSGLVSAIAELRRADHIDGDGRMRRDGPLSARFAELDGIVGLGLGPGGGAPYLLQTDVRAFQSAKAAVAAAIVATVQAARIKPKAVDRLVVAGSFGGSLLVDDLVELGVLPRDLKAVIETIDAAAMLGAAMLAFDPSLIEGVAAAVEGAAHVELASTPGFSEAFVKHTALEPYRLARGLFG